MIGLTLLVGFHTVVATWYSTDGRLWVLPVLLPVDWWSGKALIYFFDIRQDILTAVYKSPLESSLSFNIPSWFSSVFVKAPKVPRQFLIEAIYTDSFPQSCGQRGKLQLSQSETIRTAEQLRVSRGHWYMRSCIMHVLNRGVKVAIMTQ